MKSLSPPLFFLSAQFKGGGPLVHLQYRQWTEPIRIYYDSWRWMEKLWPWNSSVALQAQCKISVLTWKKHSWKKCTWIMMSQGHCPSWGFGRHNLCTSSSRDLLCMERVSLSSPTIKSVDRGPSIDSLMSTILRLFLRETLSRPLHRSCVGFSSFRETVYLLLQSVLKI